MTSFQVIGVLVGTAFMSATFALILRLQEKFNVRNTLRLFFLKTNLIVIWLVFSSSVAILLSNMGRSIGSLLPKSEALSRVVLESQAPIYFSDDAGSLVSFLILGTYLLGLAAMLLRIVDSYWRMRRIRRTSSARKMLGREVRVTESIVSPFSFGFFNPQIFVPLEFSLNRSREEVEVMLIHEETHVRRGDLQWKMLSLLTRAFLFFMPTAFYLHRKLDLEVEIECDRLTMLKSGLAVHQYGNLLIDTAATLQSHRPNPMFAYMSDTNLRRRIQAMTTKTYQRPVLTTLFGALILIASVTAVAAASGGSVLNSRYLVKAEIIVDGNVVSTPRFIVRANEPASLEMDSENPATSLRMTLTAEDFSSASIADGIDLKMTMDYKTPTQNLQANPRIVVLPGEKALVALDTESGGTIEMRVIAERK